MNFDPSITFLGKYLIFVAFLALPYWWWRKKKGLVIQAVASILLAETVVQAIKHLFPTPRPFEILDTARPGVFFGNAGGVDSAFPSGHTAMSMALATAVFLYNQKLSIPFFVAAVLIGTGRVLSLAHYWQDIAGGAIIGIVAAVAVKYLVSPRLRITR